MVTQGWLSFLQEELTPKFEEMSPAEVCKEGLSFFHGEEDDIGVSLIMSVEAVNMSQALQLLRTHADPNCCRLDTRHESDQDEVCVCLTPLRAACAISERWALGAPTSRSPPPPHPSRALPATTPFPASPPPAPPFPPQGSTYQDAGATAGLRRRHGLQGAGNRGLQYSLGGGPERARVAAVRGSTPETCRTRHVPPHLRRDYLRDGGRGDGGRGDGGVGDSGEGDGG